MEGLKMLLAQFGGRPGRPAVDVGSAAAFLLAAGCGNSVPAPIPAVDRRQELGVASGDRHHGVAPLDRRGPLAGPTTNGLRVDLADRREFERRALRVSHR
jgi:hypothetical protein